MIKLPGSSPCWISGIVKLPTFYQPGTILFGEMQAMTSDLYVPLTACIRQGRNIRIQPGLTKYKLELSVDGNIVDIVGIAVAEFNPDMIRSSRVFDSIPFFPIFIHNGTRTFLFISAINDLFKVTNMVCTDAPSISPYVISPMRFVERIDSLMMDSCIDYNYYNMNLAKVRKEDQIVSMLTGCMMNASDKQQILNGFINSYGFPYNSLPPEFGLIEEIRCVGDLRRFLHPYGSVPSDIAAMCRGIIDDSALDGIQERVLPIHSYDCYMNDAEDFSMVGALLSRIYELPMSDFSFPVRLDDRDCFDLYAMRCHVYDGFRHSFERITDWEIMNTCLITAFNLDQLSGNLLPDTRELKAERTWLEDIVIRDPNGNILTYIDMTWWMLACCDGLVNESILDSVTFN